MRQLILLAVVAGLSLAATYDDSVARNKMLPLSSAAYSTNPQLCLTNKFTGGQLKRQYNIKCDVFKGDKCSGFSASLSSDGAIVLAFRGTDTFLQLVSESDQSIFNAQVSWAAGGKVSKYFYDGFMAVWNGGMKDDYNALKNAHPTYEVWVTGHSLGGAMASLCASYIVQMKLADPTKVKLMTYGQPRTGDKNWAAAHDKQFAYSFRVTHSRDIVPHVPPENLEGYHHHQNEAFYKDNMAPGAKYKVCTADEDKGCSDGLDITLSIEDHLHYFQKDVSDWGTKGCK